MSFTALQSECEGDEMHKQVKDYNDNQLCTIDRQNQTKEKKQKTGNQSGYCFSYF